MKYSKIIFLGIAFFAVFSLGAQEDRLAVGVGPFGILDRNMPEGEARELYYLISKPLSNSKCTKLVSNSAWDIVMEAREKQTGIEFKNSPTYEQGKAVGAQKIIIGDVTKYNTSITRDEEKNRDKQRIEFSFVLMSVDVTSTETDAIETFTVKGEDTYVLGKLAQNAYQICKRQIEQTVKKFFNDAGIRVSILPGQNCDGSVKKLIDTGEKEEKEEVPPPHWNLFGENGNSGYISATAKEIKKRSNLIYVVEYFYSYPNDNDPEKTIEGIAREIIIDLKVEEYQGERIKLTTKSKKDTLNTLKAATKEKIDQNPNNAEPKFYVMKQSDYKE
ncbi:MAG: hypothetical protein AAF806_04625 [Bacteroidota bacterium]